jgi:hypothetical protein
VYRLTRSASTPPELDNPAILVLTYNRPHFLDRTLKSLLTVGHVTQYQIYISQDGTEFASVTSLASLYAEANPGTLSVFLYVSC